MTSKIVLSSVLTFSFLLAAPAASAAPVSLLRMGAGGASAATEVGLVNGDGQPFTLAEFRDKWIWLYLGFSNCPDACPRTLDSLATAYASLKPEQRAKLQVVFLSVDPIRDTPQQLKAYMGFYNKDFLGASGPKPALDSVAAALGTRYEVPADAKIGGVYSVGHPNEVFVIDPLGRHVGRIDAVASNLEGRIVADLGLRMAAPLVADAPSPPPSTADAWCGLPSTGDLNDPDPLKDPRMHRAATMGSGTTVLPQTSPMRMWAFKTRDPRLGDWLWMAHADMLAGYNVQGGRRGEVTWAAENWQMLQGTRYLGNGILDLRAMTSLEPFTLPPGGTPQLFQHGELYQGQPLVDKQHPHDLLGELAARYTWTPSPWWSLFGYAGLAGDPALGPGAYLHRPSAADNHWTPLAHHYQDSTHITYGVATAGARVGAFQLDGSIFNGREPDENRTTIDLGPLDSYSGRLSWFPGRNWVAQVSHGFLRKPSSTHLGDQARTTASFTGVTGTPLGRWATSLLWGQSLEFEPGYTPLPLQSYGLESQLDWDGRNHMYGRFELLDRAGLPPLPSQSHTTLRVGALTLGMARDLGAIDRYALGLGADFTAYSLDSFTVPEYGDNPLSFRVYLRLRPPTTVHPEDRNPAADGGF